MNERQKALNWWLGLKPETKKIIWRLTNIKPHWPFEAVDASTSTIMAIREEIAKLKHLDEI